MPKKPTYEELEQRVIELESAASEWKRAFDDLKRSRLLLQSSIESPKDVIILSLDSEYCYLYFNEAHSQIMRHVYGSKPKIGDCIFDHMKGSADIETVKQHYDRALSGEGHVAINQYGDGQLRYFYEVRYNPIYDESDKILGVSAFAQNITERKQAEEELSQIFSMSLDLICIADINTATFMKVNPSFTEILGHSEKDLLERPFMDFVHPDDMDATRAVIEQKLKSGAKVIDFENRYRCKDGSYRWLSWVSHPIPEQGVTYAVGRDVTESKLQVAELNKNKALLDATGRMAKVGGWELDADSLTVTWTDETYRIHELPLGEKPSLQDAIHFFHPEDRPKLEQSIQNALDRGAPYDMELRFITAKGNHLWTRTICEPEVVDGKVVRLKGTFHDITDRKHAERMLKNSEERYRRLTENSPDIVYRMSLPDGKYEYISPAVTTVFGYPPETWYENPAFIRDIIHPDWRSYLEKQWELLRNGQVPKAYEYQIVHKNGDTRWMNQRNVPVKDNNGRLIAIEAIITDITEQKRADEVIRESEERYRLIAEKTMDIIWTSSVRLTFK